MAVMKCLNRLFQFSGGWSGNGLEGKPTFDKKKEKKKKLCFKKKKGDFVISYKTVVLFVDGIRLLSFTSARLQAGWISGQLDNTR